ncbi:MAG: DUF362 domain-containing protein [Gemmatimonadota bacterium]
MTETVSDKPRVAIQRLSHAAYHDVPPFDPPNPVYAAVVRTLELLRLDAGRVGQTDWNPFGRWVKPGGCVVVKPNFVTNRDREKLLDGDQLFASSTHPSILRPLIDLAWRALQGEGTVHVVDSPIEGSDIEDTKRRIGFDDMLGELRARGVGVDWTDLRDFGYRRHFPIDDVRFAGRSYNVGWTEYVQQSGDPNGYSTIDLGPHSLLEQLPNQDRLTFHKRDYRVAARHHSGGSHAYSLSNMALDADLILNVPKLKTHKKSGVTLALKGVIGLSNRKVWLPHFRRGWPPEGDEFDRQPSRRERMANRLTRFPLWGGHTAILNFPRLGSPVSYAEGGCHPGNDTLWRTVLDLNIALVYGRRDGSLADSPQRAAVHVIDGIIGGEGDGPLRPDPKPAGLLVASLDPVALEAIGAELMGFDSRNLPTVSEAERTGKYYLGCGRLADLEVVGDPLAPCDPPFRPARYWEGLLR